MKSQWIFKTLIPHIPSCFSSILPPSKTQKLYQFPSSDLPRVVLNHLDLSLLLSASGKQGYFLLGSSIHASFIKNPQIFNPTEDFKVSNNALVLWNSLLGLYSRCGTLTVLTKLFDEMPKRDTVSWNTMVSGFLRNEEFGKGFAYFKQMRESGFCWFDQATLTTILSACDRIELYSIVKMMHGLVFLSGLNEISVGNSLITSYFKCGCVSSGRRVFDEMFERNVITWTAMISGLVQNELYEESLELFIQMRSGSVCPNSLTYLSLLTACSGLQALTEGRQIHGLLWKLGIQSELCIESSLMDMYSKCGNVNDAWQIFESAQDLDEVSMTVILAGLTQNGFKDEAKRFFVKVFESGIEIDPNMLSAVLGVFDEDTSLGLGKQIHSLGIKRSFGFNSYVSNGLINMYSKCGDLEESAKVFTRMSQRNSISWNSMIAAFARHGDGCRALQLYVEMKSEGIAPTDVTFLSLLHACSHVGLVEKGMEVLKSMTDVYGISPKAEHYACVVDMLGRAGLLSEAKTFIEGLPVKPDVLVWQALLGACSIHGDSEIGKYAANKLILETPESPAPYVSMANIYSSRGKWKERARTIKRMKETGVLKETGISWIEIEKKVHSFVVQDRMHPQAEAMHGVLEDLSELMLDEGYEPGYVTPTRVKCRT
ncbi:Pentatricopeptide repeat-containing protein [Hibiscus syriacus]|uniref:Pentatricopeptide repeat-containing protein n=1 Tax=Hibiscus syriacus TaxID=106335 RepID=A0A6A2Z0H6_HIBSY|nr:pentatricopeptide repeat-containing protein At3g05340-like [Hibiscus syriacus]KAE8685000.1 Pentatricopeptide repeat-containing protein [Hibiscus syriacus]